MTPSRVRSGRRVTDGSPSSAGERGAVLVELSLVATLLVTLVLGVLEVGAAWSDHQSVTSAARSGARVVSQVGLDAAADRQALLAIEASLGDQAGLVHRVVVFEAGADGSMPAPCVNATGGYSGGADCNVYDSGSFANLATAGWWGSGGSCGTADDNWCATTRNSAQTTATFVGVLVEVERPYLTGLFGGGTHTISETTVMRIEPSS